MRTLSFFICIILASCSAMAGNYDVCKYTYFKNGRLSTSQCYDKDNRNGQARAYDGRGNVIYEKELRRFAGHSSVSFSFYPNGAVKEAEWSSAPDGGIQWYRSKHSFAQDGTVINVQEQSNDDRPTISPSYRRQVEEPKEEYTPARKKTKSVAMECGAIYTSELWYINNTRFKIEMTSTHKYRKDDVTRVVLNPGDSVKGAYIINVQYFDDPATQYSMSAQLFARIYYETKITPAPRLTRNTAKEVRRYYYIIR